MNGTVHPDLNTYSPVTCPCPDFFLILQSFHSLLTSTRIPPGPWFFFFFLNLQSFHSLLTSTRIPPGPWFFFFYLPQIQFLNHVNLTPPIFSDKFYNNFNSLFTDPTNPHFPTFFFFKSWSTSPQNVTNSCSDEHMVGYSVPETQTSSLF